MPSLLPAVVAGFVAVLVGFTSSAVIVLQAAAAAGASPEQAGSWLLALCVGMGLTSIGLSWRHRIPVLTAWSTPGAALLAVSLPGVPMAQAIGAFMVCGALMVAAGASGAFERLARRLPMAVAGAMLAGVLLRFGLDAFSALRTEPLLVLPMCVAWLLGRRFAPRWTVPLVLAVGLAGVLGAGRLDTGALVWRWARPVFTGPSFDAGTLIGIALPLFVVTMASQNLPGIAVLRAHGYPAPVSSAIGWTGAATLLLAPFGAFALNLAAITAALCMGPSAHADPARRWLAATFAGAFYLAVGLAAGSVAALFAGLPPAFVAALAGLSLLPTSAQALGSAFETPADRDAAVVTFLVTGSGLSMLGIGSAFWGLLAGWAVVLLARRPARP